MDRFKQKTPQKLENSIAVVKISGYNKDLKENSHNYRERNSSNISNGSTNVMGMVTGSFNARFNPFNQSCDDDDMSISMASEITSVASDDSGDISLAELGLTEDYFSHPEGQFGMSTVEELELTIENCKSMILELPEKSSRRRKIVKKLVELRIKLQELKEGPEDIEPLIKHVVGHKFRKRNSSAIKYYCDVCNSLIWGVLQVWYKCRNCGFHCHSKCVNNVQRKCVAMDITNITYILNICPEVGLSAQHHRCAECKNIITIEGGSKDEARLCDYNGQYFCPSCHWNDLAVIPARVLHNWDFTPRKVSRRSCQLLSQLSKRAIINVQDINPMLFNYVEELADVRKLREDILLMKEYVVTCTKQQKLLLMLKERQHFVDDANTYSMLDLGHIQDGSLTHHMTNIHATIAQHIKFDCMCCQAKGFVCEICNSGEILFPFDVGVSTCTKCNAVFHRDCFTCIDTLCPRCERKQRRKKISSSEDGKLPSLSSSSSEDETDYMNPFKETNSTAREVTEKLQQIRITADKTANKNAVKKSSSHNLSDFMKTNPSDFKVLGFMTNESKHKS